LSPEHQAELDALMNQVAGLANRAGFRVVIITTEDDEKVVACSNLDRPKALQLAYDWSRHSVNEATVEVRRGTPS
jgi:hypothetical protein